MLDSDTRRKIDALRDILVGKIPNPQTQVEQITTGLIYKFMDDMDQESIEMGGEGSFFVGDYEKYAWKNLLDPKLSGVDKVNLYSQAIESMYLNPSAPQLFRDIFKNAFLPFKDPSTLNMFLKEINEFHYSHSEKLGDAFEYLISIMGSQGDAGQFRTPRHIIDFIVEIIDPQKNETILDPACGTAGFLISSYKHILKTNTGKKIGDKLSAEDKKKVGENVTGYDISPEMIRLSLVNMYLHGFSTPKIDEYDTLSSEDKWNEYFDVILANPPFFSPKGGIQPHKRFGVESKKAEVLFTSYILEHLKPNGRAAIIVPEGIIFQTGKAYKELRKQLIENGLVGVISLPAGVFNPYAGVKTSILILDKKLNKEIDSIFFGMVEKDGFDLGAQRNPIKENDLSSVLINFKNFCANVDGDYESVEKELIVGSGDYSFSLSKFKRVEVISDYPIVQLGDICELYQPKTITQKDLVEDGPYDVYGANGIIGKYHSYNHEHPEIAITCRGATCGTVNLTNPQCWITGNAMVCKPHNDAKVLKMYLYNFLRFSDVSSVITGSAQPQITRTNISDFQIPLPPLEVQQEIVDELEGYQKIIDGCKQVVENYKPTIDIDPSWEMVELKDITTLITDGPHNSPRYQNTGIPMVDSKDINNFFEIEENFATKFISNETDLEISKRCKPQANDLLVSSRGTIGKMAIVKDGQNFNIMGNIILIRAEERLLPDFLMFYLSSKIKDLKRLAHGTSQNGLYLNQVRSFITHVPAIETQKEIVLKIEEERKVIYGNKKLIEIYTQKIQDRINKVWGED